MGTSLDALNAPSSLTQRRQAASNLPSFELPPPSNLQLAAGFGQKFPSLSTIHSSQPPHQVSVGNLLTPPSNSASENSSGSVNVPVANGTTPNSQGMPVLPYTPTFWNTGNTPNGYSSGFTPQPWQNSNPLFPPRSMFSPAASFQRSNSNNNNSQNVGENSALPPPPYESHSIPPFSHSVGLASPTSSGGHRGQQQSMTSHMMHKTGRPHSQQQPTQSGDNKSHSAPSLYGGMNTTSAPSQYSYPAPTTMSQSPHTSSAPVSRVSPPLHQHSLGQSAPQNHFIRPPYPSYSLPAMPGPAMTNVHSPGAQMSMVGNMQAGMLPMGFNSGYAANPQAMYGQQRANSPQQPSNNDRPFKCDQCPQSFNRNHDLKRHKRIHLAVKPFPCNHCDKSFSRKDALKVRDGVSSILPNQANVITEAYTGQGLWQSRLRRSQWLRGYCQVGIRQRRCQREPCCGGDERVKRNRTRSSISTLSSPLRPCDGRPRSSASIRGDYGS